MGFQRTVKVAGAYEFTKAEVVVHGGSSQEKFAARLSVQVFTGAVTMTLRPTIEEARALAAALIAAADASEAKPA